MAVEGGAGEAVEEAVEEVEVMEAILNTTTHTMDRITRVLLILITTDRYLVILRVG